MVICEIIEEFQWFPHCWTHKSFLPSPSLHDVITMCAVLIQLTLAHYYISYTCLSEVLSGTDLVKTDGVGDGSWGTVSCVACGAGACMLDMTCWRYHCDHRRINALSLPFWPDWMVLHVNGCHLVRGRGQRQWLGHICDRNHSLPIILLYASLLSVICG